MKNILVVSMFFLLCFNVLAQDATKSKPDPKSFNRAFFVRPLNIVDYTNSRITLGVEKELSENKFLSISGSYYFKSFILSNPDTKYWEFKPQNTWGLASEIEVKKFRKKLVYYAAAFNVGFFNYYASQLFEKKVPNGNFDEWIAHLNIDKWWIEPNIKIGKRLRPSNRLFIDFYTGIGLRLKNTRYQNNSLGSEYVIQKSFNVFYFRERNGTFFSPTLKAGISFGYKYRK